MVGGYVSQVSAGSISPGDGCETLNLESSIMDLLVATYQQGRKPLRVQRKFAGTGFLCWGDLWFVGLDNWCLRADVPIGLHSTFGVLFRHDRCGRLK